MKESAIGILINHQEQGLIWDKIQAGKRLLPADALYLYEEAPLGLTAAMANWVREQRHEDKTYFNRNIHIEPTNVCIYDCKFCSYSRLIKERNQGWEYTKDQMMDILRTQKDKPITEVHIVGGVLPQYDLDFYIDLFKSIKLEYPHLHIKSLTPVELYYIFKKAKISIEAGLTSLKSAGLDSLPGGGAEIFDDHVRNEICADKCGTEDWLKIHSAWHQLGGRSNATILYGHIETYAHRIDHMDRLRSLQDETGGFQTYIPLKFRNKENQMSHVPEVTSLEDMKNYAVSRLYLDNFDHIKSYWPMLGRDMAQLSLSYGVDDIDGTIDDTTKIYSMAGAEEQNPAMTTEELVQLIQKAGRKAVERDTLYNVVKEWNEPIAAGRLRSYFALPVIEN
ncbi:MAG: CofH family radical SAM protein [Saprospiraceae bacterium]|nr:CofH family radical SAM protein [Saprospiraceae bacterium]MBL0113325.1 CofH family radical SAM protein [Saprospiraceae bacterium]